MDSLDPETDLSLDACDEGCATQTQHTTHIVRATQFRI